MDIIEGAINPPYRAGFFAPGRTLATVDQAQQTLMDGTILNLGQLNAVDTRFSQSDYIAAILSPFGEVVLSPDGDLIIITN